MSFAIQPSMKEILRKIVTAIILINLVVSTTAFAQSPTPLVLNNLEQAIAKEDVIPQSSNLDDVNDDQEALQFVFTVSPNQVTPGDEVEFVITLTNTSTKELSGVRVSNFLPSLLKKPKSKNGDIAVDNKSNSIAWTSESKQENGATLLPGETITLEYSATVDTQIDHDIQILDEAEVLLNGVPTPLTASLVLNVLLEKTGRDFTLLGSKGGQANGANGHVHIKVPSGELGETDGILIQNLGQDISSNLEQPLLFFQLDVLTRDQNLQGSGASNTPEPLPTTSTTEPTSTATEVPSEASASATSDVSTTEVASEAPSETSIPSEPESAATPNVTTTPTNAPSGLEEHDEVSPLKKGKSEFNQPLEITVSFDGILNLSELGEDYAPYLATLDETSGNWTQIPLKEIDLEKNTITAEITHFSVWGVGIGSSSPQNGPNVMFYDSPYPDLFTGRSTFSFPIWSPTGRNGMAPNLSLSYSGNTANGLLGDVQSPWVGMGWNTDLIEIVREIKNGNCSPCGSGSYGYENKYLLMVNGTGFELLPDATVPGRYHTKIESFLYIQLHNDALGNNNPVAQNAGGEWWEVVERDGTRWRLGWNADSEQLAAMKGYPGAASGTWAALGYAGHATNVVVMRWRADRVTDTHGNYMTASYVEETRLVAGTAINYDRASYLDTILYTAHTSGSPASGYSIVFVRESRGGLDQPSTQTDWDNWDTYRLDRIDVKFGASVVRSYDLSYDVRSYADDGKSWQTTVLTSIASSGGGTNAPTIVFGYTDQNNRANCGVGCQEWAYPRLTSIANGLGGVTTFTYGNDGRPSTSWYNWRLESVVVNDGVNPNPMKTTFSYSTPCYYDSTAGWCNASNVGELVGYGQTTVTTLDFDGTTILAKAIRKFHSDEQKAGREYETQNQNASGTTLSQVNTTFTVSTSGLPSGGFFTFASAVDAYLLAGSLTRINHTEYQYDTNTGNLTTKKQFDGVPTLYRQTAYEYVTNTTAPVWILNSVSRITLTDSVGAVLAQQEFGYDGNLPATGQPTLGELTLNRIVSGSQTIDTKFIYDAYGNITDINLYKNYGVTGSQPAGTFVSYIAVYDVGTKTYPITRTNPLGHQTQTGYDFGLGLPTSVTDPNNNTTTTLYDGLGRVKEVTYPGYAQPNIKYTYPTPPVSAPFAILTEVWDQTASTYRMGGQIMDGLGRSIQKQGPFETAGALTLTDYSYNALGLTFYQGLPRTVSGTSGSYFAPSWGSVPHTAASYDALGRTTLVSYPDASNEIFSYNGLRVTTIDRNGHQKIRESDAFGRTVKVEEYLGSGSYTLYATTVYEYDARDLLKKITDAHGKQTSIGYNGFGRKDSMTDPDMGTWGYGYDVFGNLTSQTDARTCTINVLYDDLNRPTQKTYSGPGACATTPAVNYTYDSTIAGNEGIGFRTGMTDGSGSSSWVYNTLGQQTQKNQVIDGTNYSNAYTFDALNRPLTQTLPSGETLNYGYNAMGSLSSLIGSSTYVSQIHYNAAGQVIDQQLGNGLYQQACYETNTLRVSKLRTYVGPLQSCGSTPSNLKLDLSYTYQPNGNISQIVDATQGDTINYTYDELDRLLSASGDNNKNYGYNESGNVVNLTTIPNLVAVSTGSSSACGLTASGGVKCWGANDRGQLGDGTQTQQLLPVDVSGLTNGVVAIAVGDKHACALTSSGGVKCWGYNFFGQLGNNTTTDSLTPVDVSGLTSGVVAISAGGNSTCAITSSGGLKCWGGNDFGQVGDGTSTNRSAPVNVSGMTSGVSTVSVGNLFTCAVTTSGAAKCWGRNLYGNLGDGTTKNRKTPTNVSGLTSGVTDIDAGSFHTCAVMTNGGLKCWGDNSFGQVGDGTTTNRLAPVNVSGISFGISSVAAGGDHTCALLTIGGAKCWGRNQNGQVGDGTTTTPRYFPVYVSGFNSNAVTAIDTGISFSCAVTTTLGIKCWGSNSNGEFGNGATTSSSIPVSANFNVVDGYTYGDPTSAHAVTSLSNGSTYTYDANGNMTERLEGGVVYTQTFDAENHLISVTANSQTTQFIYDGDGNLVKMVKPDGSKTIFVGKTYEVDKSSSGTVTRTVTYYPAGGAVRINSTVYYLLKDHLGSTYTTTDSSGNILGEIRYYAFGETRLATGSISTDRLYTSQRYLEGIGLYHYNARFYSATLGRFISADSMIPNVYNPQDLNHFAYVRNNPVNYTDPTGHEPKYGCYEVNCTNANGTTLTSSQIASASSAYQFQCGTACSGGGDDGWEAEQENQGTYSEPTNLDASCDYSDYYCGEHRDDLGLPDYLTLNLGGSIPGLGTIISGQLSVTLDRYGNLYIAPGLALGPEAPLGFSASFSGGYIVGDAFLISGENGLEASPGEQRTEQIIGGWYANGGVCLAACAGMTQSLTSPNVGLEFFGVGIPSVSVGGGYSFLIDLTSNSGDPLWQ